MIKTVSVFWLKEENIEKEGRNICNGSLRKKSRLKAMPYYFSLSLGFVWRIKISDRFSKIWEQIGKVSLSELGKEARFCKLPNISIGNCNIERILKTRRKIARSTNNYTFYKEKQELPKESILYLNVAWIKWLLKN